VASPTVRAGAVSTGRCESWSEGIRMPRYAPNKMPAAVKRRYFKLIKTGLSGSAAAQEVGGYRTTPPSENLQMAEPTPH
jgi:hypothetical protein